MEDRKITIPLLMRLPGYLTYLKALPETGPAAISASTMAKDLGLGEVTVRKDLATVSGGGRRKVGHLKKDLIRSIEDLLDYGNTLRAVLVGTDRLGQALLSSLDFESQGTQIMAGFDLLSDQEQELDGKPILPLHHLEHFCSQNRIRMGVITVPADSAQSVCDRLIGCGINVIWNFAPANLQVPEHVLVQNVDLAASLAALRMKQIRQKQQSTDLS